MVGGRRMAKVGQPVTGETPDIPLVSVVIPMYQAEAWIMETLESVTSQTHPWVETIVVDDGSLDRGADLVSVFAESAERPVRLVRTTNKGVAAARNLEIAGSSRAYVALLDTDDLWQPAKLELQVAQLEMSGSPMCTCGYEFFDDRTRRRIGVVRFDDGSRDYWKEPFCGRVDGCKDLIWITLQVRSTWGFFSVNSHCSATCRKY